MSAVARGGIALQATALATMPAQRPLTGPIVLSLTAGLLASAIAATARAADDPPPPPAPLAAALAEALSFARDDRVVMTYYFYWYDRTTGAHLTDPDGSDALTTHPATLEDFSYRSVAWHRRQLEDMAAAGIDVALAVFWGAPSERDPKAGLHWSFAGLGPLVEAREQLLKAGKNPPRIGLFYDTSTLQHNAAGRHIDLTTDAGKAWFFETVRDFFATIPPKHWAQIDGRPIVSLYGASFARAHDATLTADLNRRFAAEFVGRTPFLIREISWAIPADAVYAWGGAVSPRLLDVAAIGPGYDDSAVLGRTPLVVSRQGGAFYETAWRRVLRRGPKLVVLETWNEFHEGTDIAESRESGRQYIDLTRRYVDRFKAGLGPEPRPGRFSAARSVSIGFGPGGDDAMGLTRLDPGDGRTVERIDGRAPAAGSGPRFLYVAADASFLDAGVSGLTLHVTFRDVAPGRLTVQYDGSDPAAPFAGAYSPSPDVVTLTGSGALRTARFRLPGARLTGAQNDGADLRLAIEAPDLVVRRLTLERDGPTASPRP